MTLVPPAPGLATEVGAAPAPHPAAVGAPAILSLGAYLPATVLTNADLERMVETSDTWILERTGIRERRRAGSGETASMMGAQAAREALERAGNPTLDAIIVATATPDTLFPSTACLVQRRLGLPGVPAFDVGAGCSGFVYGLTLADALSRSGRAGTVLVVGTEAMTSLVDYADRGTCVLFGDGAGAAVVGATARGGLRATWWGADGADADIIHYGTDSSGSSPAAIRMLGKGTFRLAVERMVETARHLCEQAGWSPDEVHHVVPHQANLRIIEAVAKRLGVGPDRLIVNGDRFGNTSSASIPIALEEAQREGRLHSGDKVLLVAFGTGSTWGGVALEWAG